MLIVEHKYSPKCSDEDDSDSETSVDSESLERLEPPSYPTEFLAKIKELKLILDIDIYGCDGKWNLFVAAALSYKWEYLLHPVPPRYNGNVTDINRLLIIINETPKLRTLRKFISQKNYDACNPYVIEVLHWVLLTMAEPAFRLLNAQEFQKVIKTSDLRVNGVSPTHVFEMCTEMSSEQEKVFQSKSTNFSKKFGFYGAPPGEFYSILFNGFLNKKMMSYDKYENLKNDVIHLTTDLSISLIHSASQACWGASSCGAILRCVAICEYIDRSDCVHIRNEYNQKHKDIFVNDGEVIRPRFMIFFGERLPPLADDEDFEIMNQMFTDGSLKQENNKYFTVGCCIVAVASLGFLYQRNTLGIKQLVEYGVSHLIEKLEV